MKGDACDAMIEGALKLGRRCCCYISCVCCMVCVTQ